MVFLNPWFLLGLLSLSIPVLVHLFNFRRYTKVYFSDVRFLRQLDEKTRKTRDLKNILILIMRLLTVFFLVLAFAQPMIPGPSQSRKGKTVVSVFVDNSYSMQLSGKNRSLFESAKKAAKEIAMSYPADMRFQLLSHNMSGQEQRFVSRDAFIRAVDALKVSSASNSYDKLYKRIQEAQSAEGAELQKVYVLSDFQKHMGLYPADSAQDVFVLPYVSFERSNLSIDSVWIDNPLVFKGQPYKLFVRVKNASDKPSGSLRLTVSLNGSVKGIRELSLEPESSYTDTIVMTSGSGGWNDVHCTIIDKPITFDDEYFATYKVLEAVPALSIGEKVPNNYLQALFNVRSFFDARQWQSGLVDYSALDTFQFIILDGIVNPSGGLASSLEGFLEGGGNIAIFPPQGANLSVWNPFLQSLGAGLLDAPDSKIKTANYVNVEEPLFRDVFERAPKNISLPGAKYSYPIRESISTPGEKIIGFPDDNALVMSFTHGNGKVYLFACPLDGEYTDFPSHALFAPLLFKMAVVGRVNREIAYTIGKDARIKVNRVSTGADKIFKVKKGEQTFIPNQQRSGAGLELLPGSEFQQSGIYSIIDDGNREVGRFALNTSRQESELSFTEVEDLKKNYAGTKVQVLGENPQAAGNQVTEVDRGKPLWKLCIILALLFILAEALIIRFLKDNDIKSAVVTPS